MGRGKRKGEGVAWHPPACRTHCLARSRGCASPAPPRCFHANFIYLFLTQPTRQKQIVCQIISSLRRKLDLAQPKRRWRWRRRRSAVGFSLSCRLCGGGGRARAASAPAVSCDASLNGRRKRAELEKMKDGESSFLRSRPRQAWGVEERGGGGLQSRSLTVMTEGLIDGLIDWLTFDTAGSNVCERLVCYHRSAAEPNPPPAYPPITTRLPPPTPVCCCPRQRGPQLPGKYLPFFSSFLSSLFFPGRAGPTFFPLDILLFFVSWFFAFFMLGFFVCVSLSLVPH